MKKIRILRITVSTLLFLITAAGFSGVFQLAAKGAKLQFFPAFAAGSFIALLWIGAALLWGRVFCSFGCPLGYIQDAAGFIGRKLRKKSCSAQPPRRLLRYSAGIFLLVLFAFGLGSAAGFLEPFSVTGRFFNTCLRPALQWFGNKTGLWNFSEIIPVVSGVAAAGIFFMVLIAAGAFFRERLFCNTLCPAGFLLGLFSRLARFRLKIGENCVRCKACEKVCKSGCIDLVNAKIDNERCILCGNCLAACKFSALTTADSFLPDTEVPEKFDGKRRLFLTGIALAGAAGAVGTSPLLKPAGEKIPCAPPGAGSIEEFNRKCTGCQLCVANCPGKVLTPAGLEYGLAGIGQPRMNTNHGFCDPKCSNCNNICPAGALRPLSLEEKKRCRVGMVTYYRNRCVVVTDGEACGACAEHCPTGALDMVEYKDGLTIPKVIPELCIGCGGCEYVCPVRPQRAVVISGLLKQETAADPAKYRGRNTVTKKPEPAKNDAVFPF